MRTQSKAARLEHQPPKQVSERFADAFADTFGNGQCISIGTLVERMNG